MPGRPGDSGGPGERDTAEEPFPKRLAFSVWVIQLYNGIQYSEIFTLAVYVVRRFEGPGASEARIGQLAGLLAATSSFAMGLAAWPWGLFSDYAGRKAVCLLGNLVTSACIVAFSLAGSYGAALVSRLLAGLLDGSLVMTKVMVGESCGPLMQGKVMGYLALGDAMGNIIGPALGGLLSNPCRLDWLRGTGLCGTGGLLDAHPFLLPAVMTACLGIATTVINVLTMDETLPRLRKAQSSGARYALLTADEEAAVAGQADVALAAQQPAPKEAEWQTSEPSPSAQAGAIELQAGRQLRTHDSAASTLSQLEEPRAGKHARLGSSESDEEGVPLWEPIPEGRKPQAHASAAEQQQQSQVPAGEARWWRSRPLLLTLAVTALMLSISKFVDELGPIFVSAPVSQGGLGLPLDAFALPLSLAGVVLTAFALLGYPRLQAAAGLKATCAIGLLAGIPGDLVLPSAALLRATPLLVQATLFVGLCITKLAVQTSFTASMVIINSLAPREQLGSVNGARMCFAALGRSAGPLLGGTLWGVSTGLRFPGHHYLAFLAASAALVGCWALHHSIRLDIPSA